MERESSSMNMNKELRVIRNLGASNNFQSHTEQNHSKHLHGKNPQIIQNLILQAELRKRERAIMLERKEIRARKRENAMFGIKKSYLTPEYKKKLNEDGLWSKDDGTIKSAKADTPNLDDSHFYNLILDQKT
eukprot:gnl/TRDRNA2_/TRDRNA2_176558_c0_seq1.p1 gnl/TRDRNA2_/TRDRNA2_176558_c0~~gnl/TRDRNA2_/TRDRNA2_176558_c0_seq1.p1  ORF type:complete len:132 (+),score=3.28 gnl/TRDRNA2_/TRDRNA2_176558_c0_seq1:168-563(+)